mmetsp:Transcript_1252/g.3902  ORF Transcript_1252/g.3902 Transcript_1252/m.3902 type:complete len:211 (-) Transcript_1252:839-1471(-)
MPRHGRRERAHLAGTASNMVSPLGCEFGGRSSSAGDSPVQGGVSYSDLEPEESQPDLVEATTVTNLPQSRRDERQSSPAHVPASLPATPSGCTQHRSSVASGLPKGGHQDGLAASRRQSTHASRSPRSASQQERTTATMPGPATLCAATARCGLPWVMTRVAQSTRPLRFPLTDYAWPGRRARTEPARASTRVARLPPSSARPRRRWPSD